MFRSFRRLFILFTITLSLAVGSNSVAAGSRPQAVTIGIAVPVEHPALNDIINGIKKELANIGPNVTYLEKNAQGDPNKFSTVIDELISKNVTVLVPITTPLSQIAVKAGKSRIRIVFSGVTDPVGAKIVSSLEKPGEVTGCSDLWPFKEQLALIKEILPTVKKVGVMYNPDEQNSAFGIKHIRVYAKELGIELIEGAVKDQNDLSARINSLASEVDAFYVSSDNLVTENIEVLLKIQKMNKIPVFAGEVGAVKKGAIGAVSIAYFDLGVQTGKLIKRVLNGEKPGDIPVYVAKEGHIYLNGKMAGALGIKLPQKIKAKAAEIF